MWSPPPQEVHAIPPSSCPPPVREGSFKGLPVMPGAHPRVVTFKGPLGSLAWEWCGKCLQIRNISPAHLTTWSDLSSHLHGRLFQLPGPTPGLAGWGRHSPVTIGCFLLAICHENIAQFVQKNSKRARAKGMIRQGQVSYAGIVMQLTHIQ